MSPHSTLLSMDLLLIAGIVPESSKDKGIFYLLLFFYYS